MKRFTPFLLPEYLLTMPIFASTLFWALFIHFADTINNKPGQYIVRFFMIIGVHIFLFGFIYLANLLVLRNIKASRVPIGLLIATLVGTALRGVLIDDFAYRFGISSESHIIMRAVMNMVNTTLVMCVATIATAKVRHHFINKAQLITEQSRLLYVQDVALNRLKEVDGKIVDSIREELLSHTTSLKGTSARSALTILRKTIDEVVQPLSNHLDKNFSAWTPPLVPVEELKIDWRTIFRDSIRPTGINYTFIPFLLLLLGTPGVLANFGPRVGIFVLVRAMLIGIVVGYIMQKISLRTTHRAFSFFSTLIVTGLIMGISTLNQPSLSQSPYIFLIEAPIFAVILGFFVSLGLTAEQRTQEIEAHLLQTTQELTWGVARVRELQRQRQRNLARTLHGEVQAKLASSFLHLQNAVENGANTDEIIAQLVPEIEKTIDQINEKGNTPDHLAIVLEKVQSNWAGVADISVHVSMSTMHEIERDPLCLTSIVDLIPELCFNSIKHGGASKIEISMEILNNRTVELFITDNGHKPISSGRQGLGSTLLDESTMNWSRTIEDGSTVTRAEFAYSSADLG